MWLCSLDVCNGASRTMRLMSISSFKTFILFVSFFSLALSIASGLFLDFVLQKKTKKIRKNQHTSTDPYFNIFIFTFDVSDGRAHFLLYSSNISFSLCSDLTNNFSSFVLIQCCWSIVERIIIIMIIIKGKNPKNTHV